MKPIEQVPPMAALDFTPSLPNGDRALPLRLQAVALFLQEDIGQHGQAPEAHNGTCAHQLILIQAQFFLFLQPRVARSNRCHTPRGRNVMARKASAFRHW